MLHRLIALITTLMLAGPVLALCEGKDMLSRMASVQRAALDRAVANAPFAVGNHWRASKGNSTINVIGTFHLYDPRMEAKAASLELVVKAADGLYVEATDAEMKQMQREIARRPELLFVNKGKTLPERLEPEEWKNLSDEMRARSIPPFMAAKFQPWYVTMLLSLPPCAMDAMMSEPEGLDRLLMDAADAEGVPLLPLEPFDTVFQIFGNMSDEDQLDMVRTTLAFSGHAEDMFATMTEAYFSEEHRKIWEFSRLQAMAAQGADPAEMSQDFAKMEEALLYGRNRAWMEVILPAAREHHIVVAVGAAHLSGEQGVLQLLKNAGYTIERLPF